MLREVLFSPHGWSQWCIFAVLQLALKRTVPRGGSGQCMSVLEVWLGSPVIHNCILVCGIVCYNVLLPKTTSMLWNRVMKKGKNTQWLPLQISHSEHRDESWVVFLFFSTHTWVFHFLLSQWKEHGLWKTSRYTTVLETCLLCLGFTTHGEHRLQ